jgi:hypothetical protein
MLSFRFSAVETWRTRIADRDVRSGAWLSVLGAIGVWLASGLDPGTLARPGGGFLPMLAGLAAMISGLGLAAWALWRTDAVCADAPIVWRPVGFMLGAPLAFALALEAAGLALACASAATAAAWATGATGPRALAIGAILGTGFYLLFGVAFAVR